MAPVPTRWVPRERSMTRNRFPGVAPRRRRRGALERATIGRGSLARSRILDEPFPTRHADSMLYDRVGTGWTATTATHRRRRRRPGPPFATTLAGSGSPALPGNGVPRVVLPSHTSADRRLPLPRAGGRHGGRASLSTAPPSRYVGIRAGSELAVTAGALGLLR